MLNQKQLNNLLVAVIFCVLFIAAGCNEAEEPESGVTGDCKFKEINVNFNPNPVNIYAGSSAEIEVEIVVLSNCENLADRIAICDPDEYADPSECDITLCEMEDVVNNMGTCNFNVAIPSNTPDGILQEQFAIFACNFSCDVTKDTIVELEVNVLPPDFSLDVQTWPFFVYQDSVEVNLVGINRHGSHTEEIYLTLDGLPDFTSYFFNPNPYPSNQNVGNLTISAEYTAAIDEHQIIVTGHDGTNERHDNILLSIVEPFHLSFFEDSTSIVQGQSDFLYIQTNRAPGYIQPIVLAAEGDILGQGENSVEIIIDPNPNFQASSTTVTFNVGQSVVPNTYMITFSGTVGNLVKTTEFPLMVVEE